MKKYKNILIGNDAFFPDWKLILNNINKENIVFCNFDNLNEVKSAILNNNIKYILPLSNNDYEFIKKYNFDNCVEILYPSNEIFILLNNKNLFTKFMLDNYIDYIPEIYYLDNIKIKDTEYPAIYKPTYSTNGINMIIIYNNNDFSKLKNHNNIQKFVDNEYEYSAHLLCINGKIINNKIIRFKYEKYNIKKTNFPNDYENVEDFNIEIFAKIMHNLNYSGGVCIDFKFDEKNKKMYIFEINPRFGGSAFTCNFIYELLCIV